MDDISPEEWELFQAQIARDNAARAVPVLPVTEIEREVILPAPEGKIQDRVKSNNTRPTRAPLTFYPWNKWMNGKDHVAVEDVDFYIRASQFQVVLHNTARRYGVFVVTRQTTTDEGVAAIKFRFVATPMGALKTKQEWRKRKATEWFEVDEEGNRVD